MTYGLKNDCRVARFWMHFPPIAHFVKYARNDGLLFYSTVLLIMKKVSGIDYNLFLSEYKPPQKPAPTP